MGTGPDRGAIFRLEYLKGNLFIMGQDPLLSKFCL